MKIGYFNFFLNLSMAIISALLLAFSFPRYDLEVLAWISLIPLLYIIKWNNHKSALLWCWFSGVLFYLITINWLTVTMHNYGGMPSWMSFLTLLFLSLYLGLYTGLFGLILSLFIRNRKGLIIFIAPSLWVTLEYIRAHVLTGFPWASLGYSQYKFLTLIQISDLTGYLGVSFLVVGVNILLFEILQLRKHGSSRLSLPNIISILAFLTLLGLSLLYGYRKLYDTSYLDREKEIKISVLQGNIPQGIKWDPSFKETTINIYEGLTKEANKNYPDIIIWPEASTPFFFQDKSFYQQKILDLVRDENVHILLGSPSYVLQDGDTKLYNSAYLLDPSGKILYRYDKIHLVPFGEYVPLSNILFFIEKMVVGLGDFIPGKEFTIMEIPEGRFGVVICYEVIFPELVRKFVKNGAEFMVTITNDAWFEKTSAPYQHFSMVVFRSIENRVYFARSANTGISGFISPTGEIIARSPIFVKDSITYTVFPSTIKTFYTLYGDVFAYICISITIISIVVAVIKAYLRNPASHN